MKMSINDIKNLMLIIALVDIIFSMSFLLYVTQDTAMTTSYSDKSEIIEETEAQVAGELSEKIKAISVDTSDSLLLSGDYSESRNDSLEDIFYSLIEGKHRVNESMEYNFGLNGLYSGFFDDYNANVSGYSYEIISAGERTVLNIYNSDKSEMVTYELILSDAMQVTLYYPATEFRIRLE